MHTWSTLIPTFLIVSLLIVPQSSASSIPADRISVYFSRQDRNLEEVLLSLYQEVQKGGYIWVITSALTHPALGHALVEARKHGVDVRLISDRGKLDTKRDEIAMYNLKAQGIAIKVSQFSGALRLEASIVDDRYLVVGSYDYGSTEIRSPLGTRVDEQNLLIIPRGVDKLILQRYKDEFQRMWNDQKSYKTLE
ncbi:MAG TPA: phospholipase D-like domain-containing protein [Syntrophorhabdales bacterium]|nr:phospholipase D-like domain-containing protein [Syntrophorhabdales bacterium]